MSRVLHLMCLALSLWSAQGQNLSAPDALFKDSFRFWSAFRDPHNGLWCDTIYFNQSSVCGDKASDFYSSAGTGMGLISDCVFAEVGLLSRSGAQARALQTLLTIDGSWPREKFSGFFVHFTGPRFDAKSEFSTVDTAEMALGALFAGNYFGGNVS